MNLSPLQLEGYYVKHIEFALRPSIEGEGSYFAPRGLQFMPEEQPELDPIQIKLRGGGGSNVDDPSRWRFNLEVKSDNKKDSNYPYDFSIEVVGYFKVFFEEPLGKDEILIRVNATSLLYSTAREALAAVTSRGPYPGVLLPSVSFANSPLTESQKRKTKKPSSTGIKPKKQASKSVRKSTRKSSKTSVKKLPRKSKAKTASK